MLNRVKAVALCLLVCGTGAVAQTTVTTSGGTANTVPKFSGSSTVVNSAITESNGNVGIGTSTPSGTLVVAGGTASASTNGSNIQITAQSAGSGNQNGGNIVLTPGAATGTGTPGAIQVGGNMLEFDYSDRFIQVVPSPLDSTSRWVVFENTYSANPTGAFNFQNDLGTSIFMIRTSGNVGIGTTNPGAKLEVDGSVKLTSGSNATMTFQDGTVQSTAWTGVLCGGDYAESVDVSGDVKHYGPGDILVIASDAGGDVEKAAEPYSTMVAGIYATKPGVIGRRQATAKGPDEVPMAMVGIVPAKASAENGPIHKGDLLVTASAPGYAMKGTDRSRMLGAVIGKAMGSLDSGTGVIEVLVTLQ